MATIYGTNGDDGLLRGTGRADAIYGLWGDDSLIGVRGRDFLYGGSGNDTLDGGAGPDFLDGSEGFDLAVYWGSTTPVRVDLRSGVVSFPGRGWPTETLVGIEAIDGGSGRDTFTGNGVANLFWGQGGSDTLLGNVGADTLVGGLAADSLDGGTGGDSLVGGFGNDTMRGGTGDDLFAIGPIARLADPYTLALVDFGKDVIDGGAGSDTLFVDGPTSFVEYIEAEGSGLGLYLGAPPVRANLNLGTLRMGDSDNRSTLISIESIETGSGNDSINGSTGDNVIQAGDGANVVYALAGNDTIVGGSIMYPPLNGLQSDFDISDEVEVLNGGAGNDAIYGMGSEGVRWGGGGDPGTFAGVDVLAGGDGNDTLYGGAAFQTMSGGSGRDVFVLTDEPVYDSWDVGSGIPNFPTTTIADFERGQDVIHFEAIETNGVKSFAGVADSADLELGELGYHQSGGDTIVEARLNENDYYEMDILRITLAGHTGPLSASDFDLG